MTTSSRPIVIPAVIGPAELEASRAFVHDIELDGDDALAVGVRVELQDEAGRLFAATVSGRLGDRWEFTIQP